uniref:DNA-directed RNA polymerase RpoA/D/Rpb3-type domain-containing protein n=1 Tax=viral metagenome TaxID=1070528 RepID=A0A6C0JUV2_9ZZZZ
MSARRPFKITKPAVAQTESVFKNLTQTSKTAIKFQLAPTDVAYANVLRRVILTEVESVAFRSHILEDGSTSDIKITKNSTPMSNEMLAHRIGLLPINISNPLEWTSSEYSFKLNIVNDSPDSRDVVAADIQVLKNRGPEEDPLPIPSGEFFYPDPISKETSLLAVLKGRVGTQEPEALVFEAVASVGIGRENAQFIPVSQCSYSYTADTDPERRRDFFEKWLTAHKKVNVADLETNPNRKNELEREFNTMEVARCFIVNERGEPNSFDFTVESIGVLDPFYIVARALQVIQAKLTAYVSIDSGDLPDNMKVRPADARMKGFDFVFTEEDHTLGNLLQCWMDSNLVDSGEITYAGYKVPHPLKDEMVLRIGVDDGKETSARTAISKAAIACADMFRRWSVQWAAVGGTAAAPPSTIRAALNTARQNRFVKT